MTPNIKESTIIKAVIRKTFLFIIFLLIFFSIYTISSIKIARAGAASEPGSNNGMQQKK
jgi:hypothetical protein